MILPMAAPSAKTSKSSSFHSPDGRLADARLRIRPFPFPLLFSVCENGVGFGFEPLFSAPIPSSSVNARAC
jgi:hypothetical protein